MKNSQLVAKKVVIGALSLSLLLGSYISANDKQAEALKKLTCYLEHILEEKCDDDFKTMVDKLICLFERSDAARYAKLIAALKDAREKSYITVLGILKNAGFKDELPQEVKDYFDHKNVAISEDLLKKIVKTAMSRKGYKGLLGF